MAPLAFPRLSFDLLANRNCRKGAGVAGDVFVSGISAVADALDEINTWPGYKPTPLLDLKTTAKELAVGKIFYKDEGQRFGLKSFKAMGGAYAVARIIVRQITQETGKTGVRCRDLLSGRFSKIASRVTVTCATDGNHGRAVAWAARTFGCRAVIYCASHVSEARQQAIAAFGAEVILSQGNHEQALQEVKRDAALGGWFHISESKNASSPEIAGDVLHGFAAMFEEAARQLSSKKIPTHIFIQTAVGGLAASAIAVSELRWGHQRPTVVVVEPKGVASTYLSVEAGRPTQITAVGELDTIMGGLAAGELGNYSWPTIQYGADFCMAIPDEPAIEAMCILAEGRPPVAAGESGVAGLVGALLAAGNEEARRRLDLNAKSRILTIGTEGATDEEMYEQLVGVKAGDVANGQ